jgi:DNA repair protein RadD
MEYWNIKDGLDTSKLQVNSTYSDYTDESVRRAFEQINFCDKLTNIIERLLIKQRTVLVFTRFVQEAEYCAKKIGRKAALVYSGMKKAERERILAHFKSGEISVVLNVGILTTGFDMPSLDTVVLGRPTMSLSLYYQMVGRAIRPYPNKVGWIVDLCGSYRRFGRVEDMELLFTDKGQPAYFTNNGTKQLTNVFYKK